jgi:hypothetical protein
LSEHIEVLNKSIQSTFEEETNMLDSDPVLIFKRHYVTQHRQLRMEFLNYLDDSMTHDSLIVSTISDISKKNASCVAKFPQQVF